MAEAGTQAQGLPHGGLLGRLWIQALLLTIGASVSPLWKQPSQGVRMLLGSWWGGRASPCLAEVHQGRAPALPGVPSRRAACDGGSSLLFRARKAHKAPLVEMVSRVQWGFPARPALWAPPERMETR